MYPPSDRLPPDPFAPSDPYGPPVSAPSGSPITDPNDPRLSDPSMSNDPNVIAYLNTIYGPGGTVFNPPSPGATWNPQTQNWNPSTPPPTGGAGPGTGGPNSLPSPFTSPFTAPPPINLGGPAGIPFIPQTPTFTPPNYTPPPAFNAPAPFQAPTMQDVLNTPGYQFPLQQGLGAISADAASRGLWGSGATGKALTSYAEDYAGQQYGNIYNRALNTYQSNFDDALKAYATNAYTQYQYPYEAAFQGASAAFAPVMQGYFTQAQAGQRQNELNYSNAYQKWLDDFNQKYNTANYLLNVQRG